MKPLRYYVKESDRQSPLSPSFSPNFLLFYFSSKKGKGGIFVVCFAFGLFAFA